ncbi:MAG: hypothetical protein ACRDXC_07730 [Acidimicrobiales bacterium]
MDGSVSLDELRGMIEHSYELVVEAYHELYVGNSGAFHRVGLVTTTDCDAVTAGSRREESPV